MLAPLRPGSTFGDGFELTSILRGEEHDLLLSVRRGTERVELHVVDRGRWPGIPETASFGVAYEAPRSTAPSDACVAARDAIVAQLALHDPGGLPRVDDLALEADPEPPLVARFAARAGTLRGTLALALLTLGLLLAGTLARGALWTALLLGALGGVLRCSELGLPWVHDQDVQRALTGAEPLSRLVTNGMWQDRHPPLWFLVLHATEHFLGQSEAALRAPAALCGTLLAPAIVAAGAWLGRPRALGVLAGLAVAVSGPLVTSAREVSSIPLVALLSLALVTSLVRAEAGPTRGASLGVGVSSALLPWTYHLGLPIVVGAALGAAWLGRTARRTWYALGLGLLAAAPALAQLARTVARDHGARVAAEVRPELAWGGRGAAATARLVLQDLDGAIGWPWCLLAVAALALALGRRDRATPAALGALVLGAGAIALAAPFARVQPYYVLAVAPLTCVAVALAPGDPLRAFTVLGVAALLGTAPARWPTRAAYVPDPAAFAQAFAEVIDARPETEVLSAVHYDATLVAYSLARRRGVYLSWGDERDVDRWTPAGLGRTFSPLVFAHAATGTPDRDATERLAQRLDEGPALVLLREELPLPELRRALASCTRVALHGPAELRACPARAKDAGPRL